MGVYTIYLHTDGEVVPSFRIVECSDDIAALRRAEEELISSRRATRLEVTQGERVVGTADLLESRSR